MHDIMCVQQVDHVKGYPKYARHLPGTGSSSLADPFLWHLVPHPETSTVQPDIDRQP